MSQKPKWNPFPDIRNPDYSDPAKSETWAYYQSFYLSRPDTKLRQTPILPTNFLPGEAPIVTPEDIEEQQLLWMLEELETAKK